MQKSRKVKIIITAVLLGLTLIFIWGNSLLSMQKSGEESQSLYQIVEPVGRVFFGRLFTHDFFRKLAHFSEFFLLALEINYLYFLVHGVKKEKLAEIISAGLFVAVIDEGLQILSNRGAMVKDIFIDYSGYLVGTAVFFVVLLLIKTVKERRKKEKPKN
jgi:hypothetical protein